MTEAEWLACADPRRMLEFLRNKASDRKLRLAACAYCRSVWHLMTKASRRAVLLGEQIADGPLNDVHREAVIRAAIAATLRYEKGTGDHFFAADIAYRVPCNDGWYAAEWTMGNWPDLACGATILRDIFGNSFRPVTADPRWLTSTVRDLARTIYEDRAFDRLPILADALEDAGCDNPDILAHCHGDGPHVRGCWVVDLILGKT